MVENPVAKAFGFAEESVGWNYFEMTLSLLKISVKMAAEQETEAYGMKMGVTLAGDYSTKIGPAFSGTLWLGLIGSISYTGAGGEDVKIDGNPITLQTALVEHTGVKNNIASAGAYVGAGLHSAKQRIGRALATGTRARTSGNANHMGGSVSTGGKGD